MFSLKIMLLILINTCFLSVYGTKLHVLDKSSPKYPYSPRNGVFTGGKWESFNKKWVLPKKGSGEINVYAKGNDLYVGIFDKKDIGTTKFRYALIIGGWSNSFVRLYENGDFSKDIGGFAIQINEKVYNKFRIVLDKKNKAVSLYLNGVLAGKITVKSWNAKNARYYSFSQFGSNVIINEIPKDCKIKLPESPRNGVFTGGAWECFSKNRILSKPGNGKVSFYAKGNDIYLGLFNKERKNTVNFNTVIVIAGWGNTLAKVFKNGNFQKSIGEFPVKVNSNVFNRYEVEFNKKRKTISLWINGDFIGKVTDPKWSASNAIFYSFSQFGNNVVIDNLPSDVVPALPYSPRNGVFTGGSWQYFNKVWAFRREGSGVLKFTAKGNDIYVGFFDKKGKFTNNFKYSIIFNGWNNSRTNIYKNGDFSKAVSGFDDKVKDLNAYIKYKIIFDGKKKTISIWKDKKFVGKFTDPKWNGSKVKYFSFSQFSSNVIIKKIEVKNHHRKRRFH